MEKKYEHVRDPDSPIRCQGVNRTRQCSRVRLTLPNGELSPFCSSCGGERELKRMKEEELTLYRLDKYQSQLNSLIRSSKAKSLEDEIGIARILLQEMMNSEGEGESLKTKTPILLLILDRISKMVPAGHKLDTQMGNSFSRSAMNVIVDEIIKTISDHIEDKGVLDSISNSILQTIQRVSESSLLEE